MSIVTRPILSKGSTDKEAVRTLQGLLIKNGEAITPDGSFGPGTETAVKNLQASYGLGASGVADAAVWKILDKPAYGMDDLYTQVPLPPTTMVSGTTGVSKGWNKYGNLLAILGNDLGIASSGACAVLAVESAGDGVAPDGRMIIRFENHVFHRYWGKNNTSLFTSHFQMDSKEPWKAHAWRDGPGAWRVLHTKESGQNEEWAVLAFARSLPGGDTAALMSHSMGAPQIMGFNHAKVGFDTVQAMFQAFSSGERAHILGLFDFIRSNHKMVRALRTGDWKAFATIYNGPGQADYYGGKIGENVTAAKKLGIA